jgi:hypothetical protein
MVIEAGGWSYVAVVTIMLLIAAREYVRLFVHTHYRPAAPVVLAGVGLLILSAEFPALNPSHLLLALLILAALVWHLVDYERGAPASGTDFVITLGGIFYLGWLGRYFVLLRAEPFGLWWLISALTSMWLADTGAYVFAALASLRPARHGPPPQPAQDLGRLRGQRSLWGAGRGRAGSHVGPGRWAGRPAHLADRRPARPAGRRAGAAGRPGRLDDQTPERC